MTLASILLSPFAVVYLNSSIYVSFDRIYLSNEMYLKTRTLYDTDVQK